MARHTTVDFFEHQDDARRKSKLLIFYYAIAVVLIIAGIYAAAVVLFAGVQAKTAGAATTVDFWHPELFLWVSTITILVVVGSSIYKVQALNEGGDAVARLLGGRPVNPSTNDLQERKLLNVVEEMSIASGVPVPRVFLLEHESGINAFAAGFTPGDAVIGVTRGCMELLNRDELQGVIAHEFSHILNGDMKLNLRLMGVLHGILIIGIIGYWILRSSLYSSAGRRYSSSRRKGGNPLPLIIFGLVVMALGFIGVFFGKLIKSAVSRQREYLGDASAVQFTRNPSGLAGALKKIGGAQAGSRIQNGHAEEASHFFFANGLTGSFFNNLFATHPPLPERIRKIDPSWNGSFPASTATAAERAAEPLPGLAGFQSWSSGGAIANAESQTQAKQITANVGRVDEKHIAYAGAILAALPSQLKEAAREPFGARAVVYSLLLNRNKSEPQLQKLQKTAHPAVYKETLRLMKYAFSLPSEHRLPLADLAVATLRDLSEEQFHGFQQNVHTLVEADEEIDLFEYTLQRMINRYVRPLNQKALKPQIKYFGVKPVLNSCQTLLSSLSYWGAKEANDAEAAFRAGAEQLGYQQQLNLDAIENCGLGAVDEALTRLQACSPGVKKRILDACAACVTYDRAVTVDEAELLRAMADSLDCPVPPFLPETVLDS